jgi:hypothetical protein
MDETDEKSIRPLRFGVAGRKRNFHGCLPLVKVVLLAYHGFYFPIATKLNKKHASVRFLSSCSPVR